MTDADSATRRPHHALVVAASLAPREILSAAWPLFKRCLPICLPLAVIGVAAGATPGAEAAMNDAGRAAAYTREWWGLTAASMLLVLICYGAVLRQQLALAKGRTVPVLQTLREAAMDIPMTLALLVLLSLLFAPAMLVTARQGFDWWAGGLTVAGGALLVFGWFAWPELVANQKSPLGALTASIQLVRGRWRPIAMAASCLLAGVLVFVLLAAILIGMVMELAGQGVPSSGGLAFSRWLMALILAAPVVYGGAVTVSAWLAAQRTAR